MNEMNTVVTEVLTITIVITTFNVQFITPVGIM